MFLFTQMKQNLMDDHEAFSSAQIQIDLRI